MTEMKNKTMASNCETSFYFQCSLVWIEPELKHSALWLFAYTPTVMGGNGKWGNTRTGVQGNQKLFLLTSKPSCLPCFSQWVRVMWLFYKWKDYSCVNSTHTQDLMMPLTWDSVAFSLPCLCYFFSSPEMRSLWYHLQRSLCVLSLLQPGGVLFCVLFPFFHFSCFVYL